MSEWFTDAQWDTVYCDSCCPICGGRLLAGPQGGAAQNVLCSNLECREEFNLDAWGLTIDRNGKADDKRARMFGGFIRHQGAERKVKPPTWRQRLWWWCLERVGVT